VVEDCVISRNGTGVAATSSTVLERCTIAWNEGSGVSCYASSPQIRTCIIWGHFSSFAAIEGATPQVSYSCVEGDALKTLGNVEGPIDFVFIDALKRDYFKYLKILEPKLKPGAIVVADNVIVSAREMKDYLDYVQNSPNYDTVIIRASLEKKDGMSISYKIK
jgi:hypothetical protein